MIYFLLSHVSCKYMFRIKDFNAISYCPNSFLIAYTESPQKVNVKNDIFPNISKIKRWLYINKNLTCTTWRLWSE